MMKTILFICSVFSLSGLSAQTALIAHKSHSGNAANYFIDPNSNFGIDESTTRGAKTFEYVPINDKEYIRNVKNVHNYTIQSDTLKKPKYMSYEKFAEKDQKKVQKSFEKAEKKAAADYEKMMKKERQEEVVPANSEKRKNNPSFLLIFFGVSAVGMALIRLLSRKSAVSN